MRRRISAIVAVGVLISGLGATTAGATPSAPGTSTAAAAGAGRGQLRRLRRQGRRRDLAAVRATGLDPHEMDITATPDGQAEVEVVLSEDQATELADQGVDLELKQIDGQSAAELSTLQAAQGFEVFRTYGGDGGIKEEFEQIAADNPDIVKLVTIGQSVNGQDIIAIKVTRRGQPGPRRSAPGHPLLLHASTPGSGSPRDEPAAGPLRRGQLRAATHDHRRGEPHRAVVRPRRQPRRLRLHLRARQPAVAQEPARQQRRRRHHPGGDGVDPNRNFPTKWGYDNEGSSDTRQRDLPRARPRRPSPETRRSTG